MVSTEAFYIGTVLLAECADISEINDGEIWPLYPENPPPIKEIDKWDRKLVPNKPPVIGDIGIDNNRKMFWFTYNGEWRAVS